jgi:hypothetical protein
MARNWQAKYLSTEHHNAYQIRSDDERVGPTPGKVGIGNGNINEKTRLGRLCPLQIIIQIEKL